MSEETKKEEIIEDNVINKEYEFKEKDPKKLFDELKTWIKKYEYLFKDLAINSSNDDICDEETYLRTFEDFKIDARHLILANMNKKTFVIRHEELITSIKTSHEKLDTYENYVKEHGGGKEGENAAMRHFLNGELTEFSQIRTQVLPMLMMELETLVSAIDANYRIIDKCRENVYREYCIIKKYLENKISIENSKNGQ